MNYTPTIWSNGMKITATRLNKLENSIEDNNPDVLILSTHGTENPGESEIDYTFNDIKNALLAGRNLYHFSDETENYSFYSTILTMGKVKRGSEDNYFVYLSGMNFASQNPNTDLISIVEK